MCKLLKSGAGDRDRTGMSLLSPRDFKSLASANFATPARGRLSGRNLTPGSGGVKLLRLTILVKCKRPVPYETGRCSTRLSGLVPAVCEAYAATLWSSFLTKALLRSTIVDTPLFTDRLKRVAWS